MKWLTLSEAARELNVSIQRVSVLARERKLRSRRKPHGRVTLVWVSAEDIEKRKQERGER